MNNTHALQDRGGGRIAPPDKTSIRLGSAQGWGILGATILGSGMVFLDGTVVNVALPAIQTDLAAPLAGLQWILDAYALFLAALLLLGGTLGDVYGRKPLFLAGLSLFTLASIVCGLAPTLALLIVARAVQGLGGALLVPGSLAVIKAVIDPRDSSRAIGFWTAGSSVTAAIGPLVGGYLISAVSWRTIFFLNVPLAAAAIVLTWRCMPQSRDEGASRALDWPGALATVAGLGGVVYGLIEGPAAGWSSPQVLIALVLGTVALILFPLRERLAAHPMVALDLFRSRNFTGANLVTLAVYFALSGAILFVVLDLQQVQGYSPLAAGAALAPFTLLLLLLSPRIGDLTDRMGARLPMTVGPVLVAVGFGLFMRMGRDTPYALTVLPGVVALGLGMAILITPLTATVLAAVPQHSVGAASGVNNTVSRVAGLLAYAVLGVVVAWRFDAALTQHVRGGHLPPAAQHTLLTHTDRLADDPIPRGLSPQQTQTAHAAVLDAFTDAFHWAMALCAVLCLAGAVLSLLLIRTPYDERDPA